MSWPYLIVSGVKYFTPTITARNHTTGEVTLTWTDYPDATFWRSRRKDGLPVMSWGLLKLATNGDVTILVSGYRSYADLTPLQIEIIHTPEFQPVLYKEEWYGWIYNYLK